MAYRKIILPNEDIVGGVHSVNGQQGDVVVDATGVGAVPSSDVGAPGGIASLDSSGKVPAAQLPSYVDDVEAYPDDTEFPTTGESGKLYLAEDTGALYRWSGGQYVAMNLGNGSSTNALTADKLSTARQLGVDLSASSTAQFDGSANQLAIPASGILPVDKGGTGGATPEAARAALGCPTIHIVDQLTLPLEDGHIYIVPVSSS